MTFDRPRLPLIVRKETFGGILFDPEQGTHVEVDREAFDFLCGWLSRGLGPATDEERALVERLCAEVPALRGAKPEHRVVADLAARLPAYRHATVLGSPTLVDLQLTRRCRMGCPHCYASSEPSGEHMHVDAALRAIDAMAEAGVCQLAIGGGEPLLHPGIVQVLHHARDRGVVPNLTTTGDGLGPQTLRALAECCGAVGLSLEGVDDEYDRRRKSGFAFFCRVLEALQSAGVQVVFQVTLSAENLRALPSIVDYCLSCPDLYGVIFLSYKPAGRGKGYQTPLSALSAAELYPRLREAFLALHGRTRVGYDCCLTPGIIGMDAELGHRGPTVLEGCTAARASVGITTGLDVVPCTFLERRPLGNLGEQTLLEIWHGDRAHAFREAMDRRVDELEACRGCTARTACLGGCPEWDLVRCNAAEQG